VTLAGHAERYGDCNLGPDGSRTVKRELLDVPYFHEVFTVPGESAVIAFQNRTVVYDILFRAT
jgi:hypothetical protein